MLCFGPSSSIRRLRRLHQGGVRSPWTPKSTVVANACLEEYPRPRGARRAAQGPPRVPRRGRVRGGGVRALAGDRADHARAASARRHVDLDVDRTGGGAAGGDRGLAADLQPSSSPTGDKVLFLRAREPEQKLEPGDVFGLFLEGDVWQLELRSGKEARLVENAFNPSWSPEGAQIAVDASWAGPRRIW